MVEVRVSEEDVCDFCSAPKPTRYFNCPDFTMDKAKPEFALPEYRSKGEWAACSPCGTLIDAGNWDGLLNRALDSLSKKYSSMPRRILANTIRRSHDLFRENYKP